VVPADVAVILVRGGSFRVWIAVIGDAHCLVIERTNGDRRIETLRGIIEDLAVAEVATLANPLVGEEPFYTLRD
jgi:hypothetical protein